jgi:hypothetical protein
MLAARTFVVDVTPVELVSLMDTRMGPRQSAGFASGASRSTFSSAWR